MRTGCVDILFVDNDNATAVRGYKVEFGRCCAVCMMRMILRMGEVVSAG